MVLRRLRLAIAVVLRHWARGEGACRGRDRHLVRGLERVEGVVTMATTDLRLVLDRLVSHLERDERATAWAALTLHVVLASGRELTHRTAAARRLGELLEELSARLREEEEDERTTRVLLVEDSDAVAGAIARLLGRSFEIVRAVDGVAARELLLAGASFDVILSDVDMPRMDGFGFLRWLRLARPDVVDRVIFMTADPDLPAARMIAVKHVHPVLRKPCTRDMLLDAVRAALGGQRGHR